jgi:hypothetical protein
MKKGLKFASVLVIVLLLCTLFPVTANAASRNVVYTCFSAGNNDQTGSGTANDPYNLFEDALNAVADGGTIYISGGKAFVNSADNAPLVISKNVTIAPTPGTTSRPTLEMRKGGIVLEGNVTFQNLTLSFPNAYRPIICANGYQLTLDNVSYNSSTRIIHVAGGNMYRINDDLTTTPVSSHTGSGSVITITGAGTNLGNIYAGSINGSFDKSVEIRLTDVSRSKIGSIYASGAVEGRYNGQNFLDPKNEPEAPSANIGLPITGGVSISLDNSYVGTIDGETGASANASLTVAPETYYTCHVTNLSALTISAGTFAPDETSSLANANVTVAAAGTLDLNALTDCSVASFTGQGGKLVMASKGHLEIAGNCTGTATLSIYMNGTAVEEHCYVLAEQTTDGQFTSDFTRTDLNLTYVYGGWWALSTNHTTVTPKLTSFALPQQSMSVTRSYLSRSYLSIPVTAEFIENSAEKDLGAIPLEFSVSFNGHTYGPYTSSYSGVSIEDLGLLLWPAGDDTGQEIQLYAFNTVQAGIYQFTITAPLSGETEVTRTLTVTVTDESTGDNWWYVSGVETGGVTVVFHNLSQQTISNGVMIAAAYQKGQMQAVEVWDTPVQAGPSQTQEALFLFPNVAYDEIRVFLCDSLQTMKPLCPSYTSTGT